MGAAKCQERSPLGHKGDVIVKSMAFSFRFPYLIYQLVDLGDAFYPFNLCFPPLQNEFGASQGALVVKNLPANAEDRGDLSSIPGSVRSPGAGNGNLLQ